MPIGLMSEYTILFADIAGSTALYESVGDQRAEAIIAKALERLSAIVSQHDGRVIKTIGDELMCQFGAAESALMAANRMHEYIDANSLRDFDQQLSIRVGAHIGSVIESRDDVYGDTVNVSARIAALARPGKTMISETTFEALPDKLRQACRLLMETHVKGKQQPLKLYDAVWEHNDQLTRIASTPRAQAGGIVLVLEYNGNKVSLESGSLRIGRGMECDLVVEAPQASRCHCDIRHSGHKFSLSDGSTNGTYIMQNSVELFFHNETVPLQQSGIISLGQMTKDNARHLIHFSIEQAN
jgi:adenylate cyclase